MHKLFRVCYRRSERFADCLMSQTNSEYRNFSRRRSDNVLADARVTRSARSGAYYYMRRVQFHNLVNGEFVIANYFYIGIYRTDKLIYVVRKAVIVIYQKYHNSPSRSETVSSALTTAFALFTHSMNSRSGTLSATIPAPARTNTRPFFL